MKVKIRSWTAVATWRWDVREDDELCGICRVDYDATCPSCKFPGDDCPLVSGACKHTFHEHCLHNWLSQDSAQGRCPMCRQLFKAVDEHQQQGDDRAPDPASSPNAETE